MQTPSPGQQRCLDAIMKFKQANGFAPSIPELAELMSMSNGMVRVHLDALERKGYIYRRPHTARAIQVLKEG